MQSTWQQFSSSFVKRLQEGSFVKITLSAYKGTEALKNVYIKRIKVKDKLMLSFVYRYATKDITKNFSEEEALQQIGSLFDAQQFNILTMFSLEADEELSIGKNGSQRYKRRPASNKELPSLQHDQEKRRKLQLNNQAYLQALGITDDTGKVYKKSQDKYKQINHFIELLSTSLKQLPPTDCIHVADMGSGKGYLTFALYDYLMNHLVRNARVTGVEYRPDMVALCNQLAEQSGFKQLSFVQGSIADYQTEVLDIIIALHACDTATDDAIAKGIKMNAGLIVVAPCCHKQIRRAMKQGKAHPVQQPLLKHGLFAERQAEMLTDTMRMLLLNYCGYSTKAVDFVADIHTPKNVLIIAERKQKPSDEDKAAILQSLQGLKAHWGIAEHYLEQFVVESATTNH